MVRSIARTYHWTPTTIDDLYLHDRDHFGLMYWYNDSLEMEKELNVKQKDNE